MSNTYQIYLISDSTGETLDRIFLALKAQFKNIKYKIHSYSFTRTENQILKILEDAKKNENSVILYTIVDNNLAKYLAKLLSTIVYKIIAFEFFSASSKIFKIWFSVLVKE